MGLKNAKAYATGMVLGVILVACAGSSSFPYKYYAIQLEDEVPNSKLLGPNPEDDLPLQFCKQSEWSRPCVVLKQEDFFEAKRAYLELIERLKQCEAGK